MNLVIQYKSAVLWRKTTLETETGPSANAKKWSQKKVNRISVFTSLKSRWVLCVSVKIEKIQPAVTPDLCNFSLIKSEQTIIKQTNINAKCILIMLFDTKQNKKINKLINHNNPYPARKQGQDKAGALEQCVQPSY